MSKEPMETSSSDAGENGTSAPRHEQVGMNLVELAQRIKQLRMEKRLTIEQLATRTGLTRSWLSKVENFRVTPSLPALFKIAADLEVRLSELVEGLDQCPELCLVRRDEGKVIDRDPSPENNTKYESMAHPRQTRAMDPFLLTIPAHGGRQQSLTHEGEEYLMVLEGKARFYYGDETYELDSGDSLYFDGSTPHRVENPFDETAKVLCVFCVSGR
ncbi:helix-turn-helix domain-containing protein [Aeoliella mucimassa]|uniref:HTH-type transcriptional regulator PuuR n=1 Tax=Aeoliella mucimassa TaxID=2527972 RepID=A0A518AQP1_9BACT|nr:cupin domain-containing protein [Aeoliella mucimassa]QDU57041.1 HTH-type transcriptional regulator PuuR [Aeoliella mucimassa]